eukprot:Filipodium_phascolosomae@DN7282_c0_g1_i1.p1
MSLRYIGSMVADCHRNMLKGGIYVYPIMNKDPKPTVMLVFQCNPMSFIVEQAGGACSDGFGRILDRHPRHLHDTTPFICGSKDMVARAEEFVHKYEAWPARDEPILRIVATSEMAYGQEEEGLHC